MRSNERTRQQAAAAGRDTYGHDVVDTWPACVACGTPIRWNADCGRPGMWRACACPGVLWTLTMDGWGRRDA